MHEPLPAQALTVAAIRSETDLFQQPPGCFVFGTALGKDLVIGIYAPDDTDNRRDGLCAEAVSVRRAGEPVANFNVVDAP